jgi:hypothetical protein
MLHSVSTAICKIFCLNLPLVDKEDCAARALAKVNEPDVENEDEEGLEGDEEEVGDGRALEKEDEEGEEGEVGDGDRRRAEIIAENTRVLLELGSRFRVTKGLFQKHLVKSVSREEGSRQGSEMPPPHKFQRQQGIQPEFVILRP